MIEFRCRKCNTLLGKIEGSAEIKCRKCHELNILIAPLKNNNTSATSANKTAGTSG